MVDSKNSYDQLRSKGLVKWKEKRILKLKEPVVLANNWKPSSKQSPG